MRIAVVGGAGKMGEWLARRLLAEGQQVVLVDRDGARLKEVGRQLGVKATTDLRGVSETEALVLAVPIAGFEEAAQALAPFTHNGQLVFDIASVKAVPVALMHRYLSHCAVLGTHPVFGPGADGICGQNVILTPTSIAEKALADRLETILRGHGASVAQMTPAKHDELMAVVLGLAHYIALVAGDTLSGLGNLKEAMQVGGPTFRALLVLIESVLREDPALYGAIQMHLPDLPGLERGFVTVAGEWAELVAGHDTGGFCDRMSALRDKLYGKP